MSVDSSLLPVWMLMVEERLGRKDIEVDAAQTVQQIIATICGALLHRYAAMNAKPMARDHRSAENEVVQCSSSSSSSSAGAQHLTRVVEGVVEEVVVQHRTILQKQLFDAFAEFRTQMGERLSMWDEQHATLHAEADGELTPRKVLHRRLEKSRKTSPLLRRSTDPRAAPEVAFTTTTNSTAVVRQRSIEQSLDEVQSLMTSCPAIKVSLQPHLSILQDLRHTLLQLQDTFGTATNTAAAASLATILTLPAPLLPVFSTEIDTCVAFVASHSLFDTTAAVKTAVTQRLLSPEAGDTMLDVLAWMWAAVANSQIAKLQEMIKELAVRKELCLDAQAADLCTSNSNESVGHSFPQQAAQGKKTAPTTNTTTTKAARVVDDNSSSPRHTRRQEGGSGAPQQTQRWSYLWSPVDGCTTATIYDELFPLPSATSAFVPPSSSPSNDDIAPLPNGNPVLQFYTAPPRRMERLRGELLSSREEQLQQRYSMANLRILKQRQ